MKVAVLGMFTAFAVILSYVESFLPVIWIPGAKLGLANLAIILVLYFCGVKEAISVSIIRILIIGMMFGNMFTIIYSIAGALCSLSIMAVLKWTGKFRIQSISVAGGVFHNMGQLIIAAFVIDTYKVLYYLPFLIITGIITGIVVGMATDLIYSRTSGFVKFE